MNFLYPGFLFSLLAVAIPILIHLFNFRKFKKVYFSNVSFLKAVQEQQSSREELRNLLILLCRMLAIVFLAFAFAKPYWSSGTDLHSEDGNLVNIYIDNSYSMEGVNKDGTLLDEAKRKAKDIARGFSPNDRFQLTTNDFEGRYQRFADREELSNLIDEIKISPVQRNLQQVINRQNTVAAGKRNLFSYILSDFQLQFTGRSPVITGSNIHLSLIRFSSNKLPNIAVDSVWSLSPVHQPGGQEKFVVHLHNYGEEDGTGIPLKLLINNRQKALSSLHIPAGKSINDTLSFSGLTAGWQKGVITIKDFPVTFDNVLNFTFKVSTEMGILHISGDPSEKHISSLFGADSYFKLRVMEESNISYAAFPAYQLIILSALKTPSSGLAQQLKTYVKNGGTVVIFPDLDLNPVVFSSFLRELSLPSVQSLSRDTVKVSSIDLKSNLFTDVFEEIPSKLDLPKINRYFIYEKSNTGNGEDLMELPPGRPFFSRYHAGAGQLYLSATSLKTDDSNLPQHPVFVPLLYKIAFTSGQDQPLYYTLGKNNLLSTAPLSMNPNQSLRLVSGSQEVIPEIRQTPGKTLLFIADQIRAAGFYKLLKTDSLLSTYAFNESRAESDSHYASDKDLRQILTTKNLAINSSRGNLSPAAMENNHMELWKLCLVLCAVFLATEVLLIRFFNKKIYKT